ncbi:MAG: isochorismate synthase, partial [Tepidiformaceae bacterium]
RFAPGGSVRDSAWRAFGGWQFVLPEIFVAMEDGRASATLTLQLSATDSECEIGAKVHQALIAPFNVRPVGQPAAADARLGRALSPDAWQAAVAAAIGEIRAGQYRKVVLARRAAERRDRCAASIGDVLTRLGTRYPACFVFKFATEGSDWIGASPELLGSVDGEVVRAASLAGTRRRSDDPRIDERLAAELLSDPKERSEHDFVAAAMREALTPLCCELRAPDGPRVMSIANIHHLSTPFEGQVREGIGILDVIAALHPTPAVGGSPRREAVEAIDRLEGMDRGWYAGPIGWADADGNGEFAVALRSGLVSSGEAMLFAGAGIVDGSEPHREFAETELKLQPLREALFGC